MEIERLQAGAARVPGDVLNNVPSAQLELERLQAEEVRIRAELDRLTHSIDDTINGQANGTSNSH